MEMPKLTPAEFIATTNQILEADLSGVLIEGEVASFKVNQGKWVFFDLKDEEASVNCFMPVWELRLPLEDGMKVIVKAVPKLTKWGKFSVTVKAVRPVGAGSLKKAYEMLKKKLMKEGLFAPEKKRKLPENIGKLGVISSTQAAGYADFLKILNARWGGMKVTVAHTQVQGLEAPDQIIRALNYFNEHGEVEVIAILRGGGSADDLSAFNDEKLVRAIAGSKIPIITGIGHEVDESLADLAADQRASTPSNAAELLTRDRKAEQRELQEKIRRIRKKIEEEILRVESESVRKVKEISRRVLEPKIMLARKQNQEKVEQVSRGILMRYLEPMSQKVQESVQKVKEKLGEELKKQEENLRYKIKILEAMNPEKVLRQGYAILSGKISPGEKVKITTFEKEIKAEIKEIYERKNDLK